MPQPHTLRCCPACGNGSWTSCPSISARASWTASSLCRAAKRPNHPHGPTCPVDTLRAWARRFVFPSFVLHRVGARGNRRRVVGYRLYVGSCPGGCRQTPLYHRICAQRPILWSVSLRASTVPIPAPPWKGTVACRYLLGSQRCSGRLHSRGCLWQAGWNVRVPRCLMQRQRRVWVVASTSPPADQHLVLRCGKDILTVEEARARPPCVWTKPSGASSGGL